jgi:hypothetical protein
MHGTTLKKIIQLLASKAQHAATTANSHTEHCKHSPESSNVEV